MSTNAHVRAPPERLVSKQRRVGAPTEATSVESLVALVHGRGWCVYCVRSRQGDQVVMQSGHVKSYFPDFVAARAMAT